MFKNLVKGIALLTKAVAVDSARIGQQAAKDLIQGPVADGLKEFRKTLEEDVVPTVQAVVKEKDLVEREATKLTPELSNALDAIQEDATDIKRLVTAAFNPVPEKKAVRAEA